MTMGLRLFDIPPDIPVWWYFTSLGLASVIIGIAKAGFGGGIAIIAVPLTANALPAEQAVGVMLPILMVADLFAAYLHWGKWSWPHLVPPLLGAVVGIGVGTAALYAFAETGMLTRGLNIAVGALCLLFVALQGYRLLGGDGMRIPPGPVGGAASGAVAGAASTIAHSAGPVMTIYYLEQKLPKSAFVSTMIMFFLILNVAKVPSYVGLGLINSRTLPQAAAFALLVPVGVVLGLWMHRRLDEKPFTAIMYAAAAAAGARMLYMGLVPG